MKDDDDDLIINEDEIEVDNIEEEAIEDSEVSPDEPESIQDEDDDEEDRIVSIGDPDPDEGEAEEESDEPKQEPVDLVKKLRKVAKGLEKKNKALEKQLSEKAKSIEKEKPIELGEKPTLAKCKYDDALFEQEIIAWDARKRKVEEQAAKKAREAEELTKSYQNKLKVYVDLKDKHSFKDFEDAEDLVKDTFSQTQQGIIVQGSDDPALLVYALGKNPKKLEELSKITDPVLFAFKVAKLETQLKVGNKKAPKPETKMSSGKSAGVSGAIDKTLERLEKEAEKTGDRSKIFAYRKTLRDKG